jgi:hypothetical protein
VSLEEIREALKESDAQPDYNGAPRITIDRWGGNVNLGEIEGLDNTQSELDLVSKNVRTLDLMTSTPAFDFVKARSDPIHQCLVIQACILNNPSLPSEIDIEDFRWALQVRLENLYACAFVDSDSFPKQLLWGLDSANPIQITQKCEFSEDGKVVPKTVTESVAYSPMGYSITIKYDGGVNGVLVRGIGWRMLEQKPGKNFENKWVNVPEGENGFRWTRGLYEVKVLLGGGKSALFPNPFDPIPVSIEGEKTWIFSPSEWKSN